MSCSCEFEYDRQQRSKGRKAKAWPKERPPEVILLNNPSFLGTVRMGFELPITFDSEDEEDIGSKPQQSTPTNPNTPNYNPTSVSLGLSCINKITADGTAAAGRHDPDGITWLTGTWPTYDGTPFDPCGKTPTQIRDFIWPDGVWKMRGLRSLFYFVNPFKDNFAPTPAEIEAWHVQLITHYRVMLGITTPLENSRRLYLLAYFADMRKYTTYWDAGYPGSLGTSYGPCVGMDPFNAHCGASFAPNCTDQAPFLNPSETCVQFTSGGAEGVFSGDSDWPWSILMARILYGIVSGEGITGHGGPFLSRPLIGTSFKCNPTSFTVRIKWSGTEEQPCP